MISPLLDGGGDESGERDEDEDEDYRRRMNRELPPTDSDDSDEGEDLDRGVEELALKLDDEGLDSSHTKTSN